MINFKRAMRISGNLLFLLLIATSAWIIDEWFDPPRTINASAQQLKVADGDSFAIGAQKLRLDGIDAPEYHQTCKDALGAVWECGKAARASLEQMLRRPGLSCITNANDKYGRAIASCSAAGIPDLSAAQVLAGMAVSHEYSGVRDCGDEEDEAREAKRGIWAGEFIQPAEWRETEPSIRIMSGTR
jgi:endonuclease YncB( thermonuclease family)